MPGLAGAWVAGTGYIQQRLASPLPTGVGGSEARTKATTTTSHRPRWPRPSSAPSRDRLRHPRDMYHRGLGGVTGTAFASTLVPCIVTADELEADRKGNGAYLAMTVWRPTRSRLRRHRHDDDTIGAGAAPIDKRPPKRR
jgi:hypothetical protein